MKLTTDWRLTEFVGLFPDGRVPVADGHPRLTLAAIRDAGLDGGLRVFVSCERCAGTEDVTAILEQAIGQGRSPLMRLLADVTARHAHLPPRPLSVDERERVRIFGVHRRGARRLHA